MRKVFLVFAAVVLLLVGYYFVQVLTPGIHLGPKAPPITIYRTLVVTGTSGR